MKRLTCSLLLLLVLAGFSASAQTFVEVIDPAGNPSLWGLEWKDGFLYATNTADDELIRIDPVTGAISENVSLTFDPRGIAWDGTNWRISTGFDSSDPRIFTIAPDGTDLGSIPAPSDLTHGLTLHDGLLFASRAYPNESAAIAGLNPTTGTEDETIAFPETQPGGIVFIDTNTFWATNVGDDGTNIEKLYKIDRLTGNVLQEVDLPDGAGRPRGLAYDGSQFMYLVVRVGTPYMIYKIDLLGDGTPDINDLPASLDFGARTFGSTFAITLDIENDGDAALQISNVQITGDAAADFSTDLIATSVSTGGSIHPEIVFGPDDYGLSEAVLSFETNDPTAPLVEIDLFGIGIYTDQHIAINPESLDFGDIRIDDGDRQSAQRETIAIVNRGQASLSVSGIETDDDAFSVLENAFPIALTTLDTAFVEIEFRPTSVQTYNASLTVSSDDPTNPSASIPLTGEGINPELSGGDVVWMVETPDNPDTSFDDPKIFSIVVPGDLTGDGVADLVFASRNYLVWAVDGNGWGEPTVLWTFSTCPNNNNCGAPSGNLQLYEYGMTTGEDFNDDGINDIVVGTEGGNDHVYVLSGVDGSVIWEVGSDADPYLASYYSVAIGPDINNDGYPEVATGTGSASDESPNPYNDRKVYLLDGATGSVLWERSTGLPNFRTNVFEYTDGQHVVVAGGGEEGNNVITAWDIESGDLEWSIEPSNTPFLLEKNYFTLESLNDVFSGGIGGLVQRISSEFGAVEWNRPSGGSSVWDIEGQFDIGGFGAIAVASSSPDVLFLDHDGNILWSYDLSDQVFDLGSFADITDDDLEEVIAVGKSGRVVLLASEDGALLWDYTFGDGSFDQSGEVVVSVPDVDGNGVPEIAFGTRDGRAYLIHGGDPITVNNEPPAVPTRFALHSAYPNPFNPTTTLSYELPTAASPTFALYDVLGRRVWEHEITNQSAGAHTLQIDGSTLSSGMYIVQMRVADVVQTISITLAK